MKLAPLAPLYERPEPWASVYVDTSGVDESTIGRRALQARQIRHDLAEQGADEATCRVVGEAVETYPYAGDAGPEGRALFAAHGELALEAPLIRKPPADVATVWGRLPHVAPLLELVPDEPDCLIAYIDRTGADFELRTAAERRPAGHVQGKAWPMHRTGRDIWSERHFQFGVENTWEENARAIADELRDCVAETGAPLVVLAGDPRERVAVHEHLLSGPTHPVVVETEHGGRAAGAAERLLDADVELAREEYLRRWTAQEVTHFEQARSMSGGHVDAAEGVPALVEAAREHRIDRLYLDPEGPDTHRQVWVGAAPDQIAVRRNDTRSLGESEPFTARADDALLRSAATTGAEAVLLPHTGRHSDGPPVGGLGALLRWPYPSTPEAG
jgi:Bacterial archaeo-eukaryotic release factor family 2